MTARVPPERISVGGIALVLHGPDEAAAVADAVNASLDHLGPWMPWAHRPTTVQEQAMRLALVVEQFHNGGDASWTIVAPDLEVAGGCGLHHVDVHEREASPVLDIGYWVHTDAAGRGYATLATAALARVAFEVLGAARVRITCDEANVRSAAVPERLGFALAEVRDDERDAPADTGRTMVWTLEAGRWAESPGAAINVSYS